MAVVHEEMVEIVDWRWLISSEKSIDERYTNNYIKKKSNSTAGQCESMQICWGYPLSLGKGLTRKCLTVKLNVKLTHTTDTIYAI